VTEAFGSMRQGETPDAGRGTVPRPAGWVLVLLLVAAAAVAAQALPALAGALELDRAAVGRGQLWRLVTGHVAHFGWAHLAADLAAFAGLLYAAARQDRRAGWAACAVAAAVGLAIWLAPQGAAVYRGLSGVDYGLLALAVTAAALRRRGWPAVGLWALLAVAAARAIVEHCIGGPLLPTSLPAGVTFVGVSHTAGLAAGAAAGVTLHIARPRER